MKTNITRKELRAAAEDNTVLNVNGHTLAQLVFCPSDSGKYRFSGTCDGVPFNEQYLAGVEKLCGLIVTGTRTRTTISTVVPKSQKVEKTAHNKEKNTAVSDRRKIEYISRCFESVADALAARKHMPAYILEDIRVLQDSAIAFARFSCNKEQQDAAAKVAVVNKRKEMLRRYIDTYDTRTIAKIQANQQAGLAYMLQKEARIKRANALICLLTIA